MLRTHLCGQISRHEIHQTVIVSGWVLNCRDHGGVIFIDLRDRSGKVQIVTDSDTPGPFTVAAAARSEYVLSVSGRVRIRPEGTVNHEFATGEIEIIATQIDLLSRAEPLPFQIDEQEISELTRLKYRFLDLRRPTMQNTIRLRDRIIYALRAFFNEREFVDIETPILTRPTPEGARDYLVPSRTHPGEFFALPQSPQLFKQLLMVAGFERYYQIARCFRDEDLRADRQPEFTQLDVEMSFIDEKDVMSLIEEMVHQLFKDILEAELPDPIPRMTYKEAVSRYGIECPDLRIALELTELTELMKGIEFKVFSGPAQDPAGRVAALHIPGGNALSRSQINQYTKYVKQYGAKGLAYIKVNDMTLGREGVQSPILKFLPDEILRVIFDRTCTKNGDLIFFCADKAGIVNDSLGALRIQIGHDMNMVEDAWKPVWIVDFPLVEWREESQRWHALHHPFTSPKPEQIELLDTQPNEILSLAYDFVLNGTEIGGGSIRIHDVDLQQRIFNILGINPQEAQEKFGFLLEGLKYGAPPHGGIAFGIDRLVAMMSGVDSIRDVIAFPKTQKASCLLAEAPNQVDHKQLGELGLRLKKT